MPLKITIVVPNDSLVFFGRFSQVSQLLLTFIVACGVYGLLAALESPFQLRYCDTFYKLACQLADRLTCKSDFCEILGDTFLRSRFHCLGMAATRP